MGEVIDVLKEGGFQKITPKPVFVLSPGYAHLSDGSKFVYAGITLLSEGKSDVIIPAPEREVEVKNLRPLGSDMLGYPTLRPVKNLRALGSDMLGYPTLRPVP